MPLPYSRSSIERLGYRLARPGESSTVDLADLQTLLLAYATVLTSTTEIVQRDLGLRPSARVKNTGTIVEKLRRQGGSWLKDMYDLAGMRVVEAVDWAGQDAIVERIVQRFADAGRPPRVIDRRAEPSHGYTAVHVVVFVDDMPVEIQVRTQLQHEWADLFEKLADRFGRGIRYGERPEHWMTQAERAAAPAAVATVYDLQYEAREATLALARSLGRGVQLVERATALGLAAGELQEYRRELEDSLAELRSDLRVYDQG